eukprot:6626561-Ditylum_brightwellii.AAC.1
MKKKGLDVPKYLQIQGNIYHRNQPSIKRIIDSPMADMVMTQYHVSKGLEVFRKEGLAEVEKELCKLVMQDVIFP